MDAKWLRNSFFYFIVLVFLIAFLVAIFNRGGGSNANDNLSTLMATAKADATGGHKDVLVQDGQNLTLKGSFPFSNSAHPSGCNMMFCDGAVRFISNTIDGTVYAKVLTSAGSKLPPDFKQLPVDQDAISQ